MLRGAFGLVYTSILPESCDPKVNMLGDALHFETR